MSFQLITGQRRAVLMIQNALRQHSLAHAYIFSGPAGTGRKRMAETLAQAIYCIEQNGDACGNCIECRKVAHRNHPDVHWTQPDGATIKIDQIRDLKKRLGFRAAQDSTRIYILEEAERMTVQAANSLLKFLEEPTSRVMAILITENGQALLPTIRSRAQIIPFVPMSPGAMIPVLLQEDHAEELVRAAVHLAPGLDAARQLILANWFAELRNVVIQLAKESHDDLASALLTIQNRVVKGDASEHVPELLELWLLWYKDIIHIRLGKRDQVVYIDQYEWLSRHAAAQGLAQQVGCMERIVELRRRLRSNVNSQLSLEGLAVGIRGIIGG